MELLSCHYIVHSLQRIIKYINYLGKDHRMCILKTSIGFMSKSTIGLANSAYNESVSLPQNSL